LPGTASSFEFASVPEASVSMSAALRGGENVSGDDHLGWVFKAVYVLVYIVAFFEVPVVSSVARLFSLRTSWKSSSLFVCYLVVLVC
jgi:hypothetical protein